MNKGLRAIPPVPTTTAGRSPVEWATFSVAAPILMWALAFLLHDASAQVKGVVGLLWFGVTPVALIGGIRAYRALRPARASGWGRALAGILLNTLVLLLLVAAFVGAAMR